MIDNDQSNFQEGYIDCVQALHFNYPLKKRDKLLDRKFHLADSLEKRRETVRELNELLKTNVFTDEQLKSNVFFMNFE